MADTEVEDNDVNKLSTFEDVLGLVGTTGCYNLLVLVACSAGETINMEKTKCQIKVYWQICWRLFS